MDTKMIIIILVFIPLITGCINDTIKNPNKDDIYIEMEMGNNVFSVNTTSIIVTIIITNTLNEKVSIYKDYQMMIILEIINPNNLSLEQINIDDFSKDRITLEPKESKEFTINLKQKQFNLDNTRFNWDVEGEYKVRAKYNDKGNIFYSEYIFFELVDGI